MSRPRVLFVSNLFPDRAEPYRGLDNATVLHHLSAEFDFRVISPRPTLFRFPVRQPREVDAAFEPLYIPAPYIPKLGSRFNHLLMARTLRGPLNALRNRWKFDAVLCSWIFPDCCAVAALAEEFPFVAIAQGSDVHQYLKIPARREVIVSAMKRASAVITRSGALAELLAGAGLDRNRLHPVYNGIDFDQFKLADKTAARHALGLPASGAIILFVGNFLPIKNPLTLLRAHGKMEGAHLVMVGGGSMETEARALARELGTESRVTFAGRRTPAEVARYMQAADVFALPSKNEGVPNVILEAFACGLPVVASRVGGIPEVHCHPFLGELIPPGDAGCLTNALQRILSAPVQSDSIHHHARQFSWEAAATKYAELLRSSVR